MKIIIINIIVTQLSYKKGLFYQNNCRSLNKDYLTEEFIKRLFYGEVIETLANF